VSLACLLCGEEFSMITPSHLKFVHNITLDDYRRMFPNAELVSAEVRRQMSESHGGLVVTEETRRLIAEKETGKEVSEGTRQLLSIAGIGNTHALGHVVDEATRQRISVSETGKIITEETRQRTSRTLMGHVVSEKTRQQIAKALEGHEVSETTRRKKSDSMRERWKDEDFARYMAEVQRRKPNGPELQLQSVLDKYFPGEWKYVGDYQFGLGGAYPDFVNVNEKKQVIEVFGYHWHDSGYFPKRMSEEELIAHYKSYGFDCIVFWEYDVYNKEEVVARIKETFG